MLSGIVIGVAWGGGHRRGGRHPPADALLTLARERQASMIVVGTSGERPLLGIVLGPTPSKLLHRATVPVLVIPTPA
jgi:nucleotide-binding universal stress UspA family protein